MPSRACGSKAEHDCHIGGIRGAEMILGCELPERRIDVAATEVLKHLRTAVGPGVHEVCVDVNDHRSDRSVPESIRNTKMFGSGLAFPRPGTGAVRVVAREGRARG